MPTRTSPSRALLGRACFELTLDAVKVRVGDASQDHELMRCPRARLRGAIAGDAALVERLREDVERAFHPAARVEDRGSEEGHPWN